MIAQTFQATAIDPAVVIVLTLATVPVMVAIDLVMVATDRATAIVPVTAVTDPAMATVRIDQTTATVPIDQTTAIARIGPVIVRTGLGKEVAASNGGPATVRTDPAIAPVAIRGRDIVPTESTIGTSGTVGDRITSSTSTTLGTTTGTAIGTTATTGSIAAGGPLIRWAGAGR